LLFVASYTARYPAAMDADLRPCLFCGNEKPTVVAMGGETIQRALASSVPNAAQ